MFDAEKAQSEFRKENMYGERTRAHQREKLCLKKPVMNIY